MARAVMCNILCQTVFCSARGQPAAVLKTVRQEAFSVKICETSLSRKAKMANELEQKIIRQMEYYFGDYNLPKDKFLQEKVKEGEGWVHLEVLLTFKRLASLTTDPEAIVKALEKTEGGIIHVSEDRKKVRRDPGKPVEELTQERRKEIMDRTAYAKGFPLGESLDNILKYLEEHGPVVSCIQRTHLDKATNERTCKGSCLIVFQDLEGCKKIVEAESIIYKDIELIRKYKRAYIEEKKQELKIRKNDRKKDFVGATAR